MTSRRGTPIALAAIAGIVLALAPAHAQERGGPTPPRLAFIDGEVSFWRPGAEDWAPARVNTALAEGDQLYAAEGANLELQLGTRAFARAGSDTQLSLESLDDDSMQFQVTGGHVAFDLARLPSGTTIEIDTPRAAYTLERPGYYRIDVDEQRTAFSARRGGVARVVAESGDEIEVSSDQALVLADDRPGFDIQSATAQDEWDRWNVERTAGYGAAPRSSTYVPADVAGVDDLDRYGDWQEEPRYGRVWRPRDMPPDWSPYSTGRWVYDPYYEWTWVDDAPWGWAPYHYGRWVYTSGFWGWAPGPVVVNPVYAPALVAFFGAPGVGVSVSVGTPFVSWCPLGFGEPVIPWWGGAAFVGHAYWGGWGGPRVVNNVVINNTRIVNVNNITHFSNMNVRNAVVGIEHDRFGRGGGRFTRVNDRGDLRPMRGQLGVRPAAQSFIPHEGRGRRPPEQFQHRAVVATRPPRDHVQQLRARGIETPNAPVGRPEARVVRPRGGGNRRFATDRQENPNAPGPDRRLEHGRAGNDFGRDRGELQRGRGDEGGRRGPGEKLGRGRGDNEAFRPERRGGNRFGNARGDRAARGDADTSAAPPPPRGQRGHDMGGAPVPPRAGRGQGRRGDERFAAPDRQRERGGDAFARPERQGPGFQRENRGRPASPRGFGEERDVRRQMPREQPRAERRMREQPSRPMHVPRDAAPVPVPRGDRTRFERRQAPPERSVRRERIDAAPMRREAPRAERGPARPAPRAPQRPQNHNGRGHHEQR